MKLLWWSVAPWCPSGYGQQTKLFLKRIERLGHELAVCAHRGLADTVTMHEESIPILPKGNDFFSQDLIAPYAKRFGAEAVISLLDVWPLPTAYLFKALPPWCPIVPIDSTPMPP